MRFHWLAVAFKFVLIAVVVKAFLVLVVLLTLPLLRSITTARLASGPRSFAAPAPDA